MHKEKFMIYRRDAKKGEATYSPKSHSAPHFEGHYVEGMEEWASWYCFNKKEDGTYEAIDIVKANIFAVAIMVVAAIVFLVPFFWLWKDKKPISELLGGFGDWSITFILVIVGIVVHELIHGLTWACYAKSGWKSISFGVMWKLLTPYCHCDEPMHIPGYMMGAMMPCIVLGVIPAIAALFIGSLPMLVWGIFFIAAAAGDIWMTWLLTKENPKSRSLSQIFGKYRNYPYLCIVKRKNVN